MLPVQKIAALGALIGFVPRRLSRGGGQSSLRRIRRRKRPWPRTPSAPPATTKAGACRFSRSTRRVTATGRIPEAPNCQSCHGESTGHQKDPAGVHPEVVFATKSKNVSSRRGAKRCLPDLSRHQNSSPHPLGRQRASEPRCDVHQLPYGSHSERPGTGEGHPARGVLRLSPDTARADAPHFDPSDPRRQDGVLRLP